MKKKKTLLTLMLAFTLGIGAAAPLRVQAQMPETEPSFTEASVEDKETDMDHTEALETEESSDALPEAGESAAEESPAYELLDTVSVTEVNPVYADSVSLEEIEDAAAQTVPGTRMLAEAPVYCTTEAEAAAALREQMKNRDHTLSVCIVTTQEWTNEERQAKIGSLMQAALEHTGVPDEGDYLRWNYSGYDGKAGGYKDTGTATYYYSYTYTIPAYYTTTVQEEELEARIGEVLSGLDLGGKSDYEKAQAIYQYVGLHTTYDKEHDKSYTRMFTAYAALFDGKAVCQGYGTLLYRMLLEAGLDCRLIAGMANGIDHAWNIIRVSGFWYNTDITWDSPILQSGSAASWFLKGENSFHNHFRNQDYTTQSFVQKYPVCDTDYVPAVEPVKETIPAVEPVKEMVPAVSVSYRTHVQTYGWQDFVKDGATSGTSGQSKRLEAIRIQVSGNENVGIRYRSHVQTYGWQDWAADGNLAGTTGLSKRLEAIQIELTGSDKDKYDVYYRVHVQTYGWLGWAKNGEVAGTTGIAKRLEAIEIVVVEKGTGDYQSGSLVSSLSGLFGVSYQTHVQTYGWQGWASNGAQAGTTGQSKRLEAIRIQLNHPLYSGGIEYRTHVQTYGWQDWVSDGALAGTTGLSKRLEAIQIRLTGDMASQYDVYYRVHVQTYGWSGWAKNGEPCGSEGYSKRLEAIEIRLVAKGNAGPSSSAGWIFRD